MASSPSTETQEAPTVQLKPLTRAAVTFAENRRNHWSATVQAGTTKEQLLQSSLWSVVCDNFSFLDRISVIWADRSAYAELLVLDAGRGHCTVHLLSLHQLPALLISEAGLPPGFDCFYAGPISNADGGYCVKRTSDGVLMCKGHTSREAALAELLDHASLRG